MGYKPDVVQKAKFEYSPLGQVFNKGLKTDEKQEGLFKRLQNIEDKTDKQLNENKNSQLGIKSIGCIVKEELSEEAKIILKKLSNQEKLINYRKLYLKGGNKAEYDFTEYRTLQEFFKAIYSRNLRIEKAERIQDEFNGVYGALEKYKPKEEPYIEKRRKLLINADNFYKGREMIIDAFKNEIFPMVPTGFSEDQEPSESRDEEEKDGILAVIKEEEPLEETAGLDKFYGPDLINKYFFFTKKKYFYIKRIINKLKDYKKKS